ncbi:MAG: ArsA family ATPase [Thermodesulfovibrionales bacterium]|jgi:arsenite-transporting ATPase
MIQRPMILFGGKGGVGKTTCSAAIALHFASSGLKTIILTSDMTPSLSDIFDEEIGDTAKEIDKNLHAVEIGQNAIVHAWKQKFGHDFYDILSHLIDVEGLDSESRHQVMDYIGSAPSLREETMLDLIVDMAESGRYDRIVWDTAPAGETLNLLAMPKYIRRHLRAGTRVFEGLDRIGKQITGKRSVADIMDEWISASERISHFLCERSTFIMVANPEALVVKQVRRVMETLKGYSLMIHGMVINRVVEHPDSESLKEVHDMQKTYLMELQDMTKGLSVAILPFSSKEMRGKKALTEAGERLSRELLL